MEIRILAELSTSILQLILLLSLAKTSYCLNNLGNETDRIALLEFKAKISSDPNGILSSWNDSMEFCKWEGVSCGKKHKRVTSLNLHGMSLMGTLSPYISNLAFLSILNLSNNKFHGVIPQQVGFLFRLSYLNLSENTFEGEIPANISYCSDLRTINLGINKLAGKIPSRLGFLNKLVLLILHFNHFTGEIPHSFGNLSSLEELSLSGNHLRGNIPDELGQLKNFSVLLVASNNLTGTIPSTLYNLSSFTQFYATENKLKGSLPSNIGLTLPKLQEFAIGVNEIHGSIPISLANASQLTFLDISENKITGQVPNNLGFLKNLQWLNIGLNFLGINTDRDMDFVASLSNCSNLETIAIYGNNFRGMLPISIANLSNLQTLSIGENMIYGKIPKGIGNLVDLYILSMRNNLFSGPIPEALGKLVNLQVLFLSGNKLSGEIPQSLCNLTRLSELSLDENKLEGNLITCIANCKNLQHLSISANFLNGSIPQQIFYLFSLITLNLSQNALTGLIPLKDSGLKNIYRMDISKNKLSGKIPEKIGDSLSLEYLYLEGNVLQGDIPSSLASLKGLQELDISQNNLSENIPTELEKLRFLSYLNLSFNNLKGEVPKKGVFSNVKAFSFEGNNDLCGGIRELQLPPCPIKAKKHKKSAKAIILGATISPIVIFIAITSLYVCYRQKSRKSPPSKLFEENKLPRISYNELLQATNGFSSDNIIGEGSFGLVYIGNLDPQREKLVAVKVLKLQQHGASNSFLAECKALRNIRHRNLVKILTYCSSIDFKGNDFKALVFDFMKNGSLEMWLHPGEASSISSRNLSLLQRLQVAIDVLSAIYYLHDNCETPIIHCDLKPSNILFDEDMTAHVSDFGLARLLSKPTNESSQSETSSIGIKGTIGYMAPEYGVGSQATKQGDIYSFGIILLEIFTGRRPTDPIFKDGLNLHNFVNTNLTAGGVLMQVLDPLLIANGDVMDEDDGGDVYKCIVAVLQIGVSCSAELPADRMSMEDLSRKLNVIVEAFLDTRARKAHYRWHGIDWDSSMHLGAVDRSLCI